MNDSEKYSRQVSFGFVIFCLFVFHFVAIKKKLHTNKILLVLQLPTYNSITYLCVTISLKYQPMKMQGASIYQI